MPTHEVQMNAKGAEEFLTRNRLMWQHVEEVDPTCCHIVTEDQDADALTDALDDEGIEWRLH